MPYYPLFSFANVYWKLQQFFLVTSFSERFLGSFEEILSKFERKSMEKHTQSSEFVKFMQFMGLYEVI